MKTYPVPRHHGGHLIREVISTLKSAGIKLPLSRPLGIAFSGGFDSMALTHVLLKYGRRVIDPGHLRLCYFDHGWDQERSKKNLGVVQDFARRWDLPLWVNHGDPPLPGCNLEADGHRKRYVWFDQLTQTGEPHNPWGDTLEWMFTAHQRDDDVETLMWRFFRGQWDTHRGGIALKRKQIVRPLLNTERSRVTAYLQEESLEPFWDESNQDPKFTRAFLRNQVIPELKKVFPGLESSVLKYKSLNFSDPSFTETDDEFQAGE